MVTLSILLILQQLTATPTAAVTAAWSGLAPATSRDWIGIYTPGSSNAAYLDWVYVSCTRAPDFPRASGSCAMPTGSLAPGTYQLRMFGNNLFSLLATSPNFTIGGSTAFAPNYAPFTYPHPLTTP